MKRETKELIDWVKKQINLSGECIVAQPNEYWKEDKTKAMKFLDSLPQIESRLCQGGYIQDSNGTPCCNGDKVTFLYHRCGVTNVAKVTVKEKGMLIWSPRYKQFVIVTDKNESFDFEDIIEFEKV